MELKSKSKMFLEVSSYLTGFSETDLRSTGMADEYLTTILKDMPSDAVDYFFGDLEPVLRHISGEDPEQREIRINKALKSGFIPQSSYGGLAGQLIILWYTGYWNGSVLSADSYIQGLMWDAGHSHPPGAKQPGYGSWANLPLSVEDHQSQK